MKISNLLPDDDFRLRLVLVENNKEPMSLATVEQAFKQYLDLARDGLQPVQVTLDASAGTYPELPKAIAMILPEVASLEVRIDTSFTINQGAKLLKLKRRFPKIHFILCIDKTSRRHVVFAKQLKADLLFHFKYTVNEMEKPKATWPDPSHRFSGLPQTIEEFMEMSHNVQTLRRYCQGRRAVVQLLTSGCEDNQRINNSWNAGIFLRHLFTTHEVAPKALERIMIIRHPQLLDYHGANDNLCDTCLQACARLFEYSVFPDGSIQPCLNRERTSDYEPATSLEASKKFIENRSPSYGINRLRTFDPMKIREITRKIIDCGPDLRIPTLGAGQSHTGSRTCG